MLLERPEHAAEIWDQGAACAGACAMPWGEPYKSGLCHCTDCRQITGSAFLPMQPGDPSNFNIPGRLPRFAGEVSVLFAGRASSVAMIVRSNLHWHPRPSTQMFRQRANCTFSQILYTTTAPTLGSHHPIPASPVRFHGSARFPYSTCDRADRAEKIGSGCGPRGSPIASSWPRNSGQLTGGGVD